MLFSGQLNLSKSYQITILKWKYVQLIILEVSKKRTTTEWSTNHKDLSIFIIHSFER